MVYYIITFSLWILAAAAAENADFFILSGNPQNATAFGAAEKFMSFALIPALCDPALSGKLDGIFGAGNLSIDAPLNYSDIF